MSSDDYRQLHHKSQRSISDTASGTGNTAAALPRTLRQTGGVNPAMNGARYFHRKDKEGGNFAYYNNEDIMSLMRQARVPILIWLGREIVATIPPVDPVLKWFGFRVGPVW